LANIRAIKRRIRSVTNTAKITKAMEMVAASKMRRSQQRVLAARPYAESMRTVLGNLAAQRTAGAELHPLLQRRPVERIEIIHITADRGLCGGLNANINRRTGAFILEQTKPVSLVTVGRKGRDFMGRYGRDIRAEFTQLGDAPLLLDVAPVARVVTDDYIGGYADQVFVAYQQFVSTVTQRPVIRQLLPIEAAEIPPERNVEYIYEPDPEVVMAQLLPRFVEMQIYHAILEGIGSEQSARMVAMHSATENANEMVQELTLTYNKARQEMITKELLDLVGGAAALEE